MLIFLIPNIYINIAQDIYVEKKMLKKDLTTFLVKTLDLTYNDLLILVMSFLKKISIFEENKNTLKECQIVSKVNKFLSCSSPVLINATLRLLFNLSFDKVSKTWIIVYVMK